MFTHIKYSCNIYRNQSELVENNRKAGVRKIKNFLFISHTVNK